ncbi:hypothetical protein ACX83E_09605, partial [Burkholderia pseudomallei]
MESPTVEECAHCRKSEFRNPMPFAYSIMRFMHDRAFARKTGRSPCERPQSRCDCAEQLSCAGRRAAAQAARAGVARPP